MTAPHPGPLAVAALHELLLAEQLDSLRIAFGDPGEIEEPDVIAVGLAVFTPQAVIGQVRRTMGHEDLPIDIACTAQSWSGDVDEAAALARMARVYELVDIVRAVLRATPDLGLPGVVQQAYVTRESFSQVPTNRGEAADIEFTVHVDAYRRR